MLPRAPKLGPLDVTPGIMPEAVDCVFSLTMIVLVGGVTVGPANVECTDWLIWCSVKYEITLICTCKFSMGI